MLGATGYLASPPRRAMDPANVIGILGVVGQIIKTIYQYSDGVAECRAEVARLRVELFGMQAALKQVEWGLQSSVAGLGTFASPNLHSEESCQVLEEAPNLLLPLAKAFDEGITRSSQLAKRLLWPLKRQNVQDIATHLERLKTYFTLAATNDSQRRPRRRCSRFESSSYQLKTRKPMKSDRPPKPRYTSGSIPTILTRLTTRSFLFIWRAPAAGSLMESSVTGC